MYIKKINKESQSLIVAIPLTTTSGKIRVKERDNIYGCATYSSIFFLK